MSVKFSKQAIAEFDAIVARYPERQAAMLPVLHLAAREFGHISNEVESYVAELLGVPHVKVHEVMTFYTLIPRKPVGKLHFQVCRGPSCDLLGCDRIMAHLSQKLGITSGQTSDDLNYTLTPVECLGACETAPMLQLNDAYHGPLTPEAVDKLVSDKESRKR